MRSCSLDGRINANAQKTAISSLNFEFIILIELVTIIIWLFLIDEMKKCNDCPAAP